MKINIFFDLDGTLIDASERLYKLFIDLIPDCKLTKQEYWSLKRQNIKHKTIIENFFSNCNNCNNFNFDDFERKWLNNIENIQYLRYDKIFDDTINILQYLTLSKKYNLYLLTARQSKENLYKELQKFQLLNYFENFKNVFITEQKYTKTEIINQQFFNLSNDDFIVGDTINDILCGKELNIKTIALTNGFINKNILEKYQPNYLCNTLTELKNIF